MRCQLTQRLANDRVIFDNEKFQRERPPARLNDKVSMLLHQDKSSKP